MNCKTGHSLLHFLFSFSLKSTKDYGNDGNKEAPQLFVFDTTRMEWQ